MLLLWIAALSVFVVVSSQQVVEFVVDSHDDVAVAIVDHAPAAYDSILAEHDFATVEGQDVFGGLRDDETTSASRTIAAGSV